MTTWVWPRKGSPVAREERPSNQHGWALHLQREHVPRLAGRLNAHACCLSEERYARTEHISLPTSCQVSDSCAFKHIQSPVEGVHPPVEGVYFRWISDGFQTGSHGEPCSFTLPMHAQVSCVPASCSCFSPSPRLSGLLFGRYLWDLLDGDLCAGVVWVESPVRMALLDLPVVLIDQALHQV